MHVAVDDYHLAAVHPTTFGKGGVYLDRDRLTYTRVGAHSIYQNIPGPDALANLIAAMANGSAIDNHYIVCPPDAGLRPVERLYLGWLFRLRSHPLRPDQSSPVTAARLDISVAASSRHKPHPWRASAGSVYPAGGLPLRTPHPGEDARAAERLQTNASTFIKSPLIGRLEERVQWYEEAYREIMAPESRMQDGTSRRDNQ
jgi:hypothetical protein